MSVVILFTPAPQVYIQFTHYSVHNTDSQSTNKQMNEQNVQMTERIKWLKQNEWTNELMNEQTNEWMNEKK